MFRIEYFDTLDSTNTYLQSRKSEDEGLVIVAKSQNKGRGQNNNQWISDTGGLYFSFLLKPKILSPTLSIMTGLVIIKTLEKFSIKNLKLKWPNDILYNEAKISGILIESKVKGAVPDYIIIGCGININQLTFSGVNEYIPTSMKIINNKSYDLNQVLNSFLEIFERYYQNYLSQKTECFIKEIQDLIYKKDQSVKIHLSDFILEGKIKALNSDGALIVETKEGEKCIYSGRILKNPST